MPVSYELDAKLACVHTRCVGDVTLDEIRAHFRSLERDASLPSPLHVLLDLTELTALPESGQLIAVADEVRRAEQQVRWGACAIAAREDVVFGVSRMLEVFVEGSFERTRVFRDLAAARAWLASPA